MGSSMPLDIDPAALLAVTVAPKMQDGGAKTQPGCQLIYLFVTFTILSQSECQ